MVKKLESCLSGMAEIDTKVHSELKVYLLHKMWINKRNTVVNLR